MIYKVVSKSLTKTKQWNIDPDEVLEAAFYGFMQAFETYTKDKGAFTNWVWQKSRNRILDLIRRKADDKKLKFQVTNEIELDAILTDPKEKFVLAEWLQTLSKDGRYVANLLFATPIEIKATLAQLGSDSPANWRMAIRELLRDQNWTNDRIKKVFHEIKEAL